MEIEEQLSFIEGIIEGLESKDYSNYYILLIEILKTEHNEN